MPGGYGTDESTPWGGSSSSGSSSSNNNNNNNNSWSSNDWAGEFAGTVSPDVVDAYVPWESSTSNLPNDYTYEGDYVPTFGNTAEDFASAYGGLSYDWVDPNSDFLTTDKYGNPLPDHGEHWYEGGGLWNPFYAGVYPEGHPKAGQPKWLNEGQFNEMMDLGEFPWPLGGSTTTGGPGPSPGGGGYGWGSGGGGGGSSRGSGGSRMQFPGAEGAGGMRGRWGQPTIQGDYIRRMRGYNRGGIVSLC
jgi:hypothetical protein